MKIDIEDISNPYRLNFKPLSEDSFEKIEPFDAISRPKHYNTHPSGIECIEITEHMNFCLGNAIKYIWRAGKKESWENAMVEDLKKAKWYIEREIERIEKETK